MLGPEIIEPPFEASPEAEPPFAMSSYKLSINYFDPSLVWGKFLVFAQSYAEPTLAPELNKLPANVPSATKP